MQEACGAPWNITGLTPAAAVIHIRQVLGLRPLFAPLAFWSPDPAAYANDRIVGVLLITFALIIAMGMKCRGTRFELVVT